MQIIRTATTRKTMILIALLVIVLLLGAGVAFAAVNGIGPFAKNDTVSSEQTTSPDQEAESEGEDTPDGPAISEEDEHPQESNGEIIRNPTRPPISEGSLNISRIDPGDPVTISAIVHGVNNGTCTVTYTKGSEQVRETAPIQSGATYFGCQIEIARSRFPSSGTWQAILEARNSSAQARAAGEVRL